MATLLSVASKLVIAISITLGISSFLIVNAHESHNHESIGSAIHVPSHEAGAELGSGKTTTMAEWIHGHSHDGFSHDHVVEFLGERTIELENPAVTVAPDDPTPLIYTPPIFEIDIPPRA
ncbi:MAG: hypothetical protein WBD34_12285 [Burkholderiaceae bacterium]